MTNTEIDVAEYYGEVEMRWYQIAARNEMIDHLSNGIQRILIVHPTGAGKTLTIAASLSDPRLKAAIGVPHDRQLRVLFSAHKHRLLTQAERTFLEDTNVELILHSIFSPIPEDALKNGWDIAVLDESHHEACATYQYQLEDLGNKPIIGLTATPERADGMVIKFEVIVNPISREQAVAEGYLAETDIFSFVDTSGRNKTDITNSIIDRYGDQFGQTLMFFATKAEVHAITQHLIDSGFNAVSIVDQPEKETNRILDSFSNGDIQFVVNCNKVSEGVDVKGCTDVFLGRNVGSYTMLNQIIGRSARPDSESRVWEMVNPLSGKNLDTTVVTGTPRSHSLHYRRRGVWMSEQFDYTSVQSSGMSQVVSQFL